MTPSPFEKSAMVRYILIIPPIPVSGTFRALDSTLQSYGCKIYKVTSTGGIQYIARHQLLDSTPNGMFFNPTVSCSYTIIDKSHEEEKKNKTMLMLKPTM